MTKDEWIRLLSLSDDKVCNEDAYDKFQDFIKWQYKKHKGEIDYIFKIYNYKEFQENVKGDIANDFYIYLRNRDKYLKKYLENIDTVEPDTIIQNLFNQYIYDEKLKGKNWNSYFLRETKKVIQKSKEINEIIQDRKKYYCYKNNRVITSKLDIEKLKKSVYLYVTKNMNDYEKTILHLLKTAEQCLTVNQIIYCLAHLENKITSHDYSKKINGNGIITDTGITKKDLQLDLEKFKKQLSDDERKVLESMEKGKNYELICQELGMKKSTYYRIKDKLRNKYKDFFDFT